MKIDCIVGIDPGAMGGIVTWRPNHNIKAIQMPKDLTDLRNYLEYLKTICSPIVFLEKLSVRPDDITPGADGVNMGKLYRIQKMLANFEQLKATIAVCDVPFVMVHPMKWQNKLKLRAKTTRKKEEKNEPEGQEKIAGSVFLEKPFQPGHFFPSLVLAQLLALAHKLPIDFPRIPPNHVPRRFVIVDHPAERV